LENGGPNVVSRNGSSDSTGNSSLVIPGEDPAELEALALDYRQQFNAAGLLEGYLVETLVQADWNRLRYTRIEAQVLQILLASQDPAAESPLDVFTGSAAQQIFRRLAATERSYFRALKELGRIQPPVILGFQVHITEAFRMISATQLRPGMVVKFNNELYSIFSVNHRTPGNLRGFVQAKMRSLRTGSMTEHRFSSEDRVEKAILEEIEMEYLYDDGEYFYFMNTENFEQMHLMKDLLGDATEYLVSQLRVKVEFYEGKPISVELPATVDLTVIETEPGFKGATVSNVTKPAKLETGLVVQVPPFIVEGEKIRVNTAEGTYQERA
jgi:elongation factor P